MKRLLRVSERVLLAAGVLALVYCLAVWGNARLFQRRQSQLLERALASEARLPAARHQRVRRQRPLVGRIQIPRIGLSAMIAEGDDARTLRRAVGHIPGTALPGQPGNVAFAGHRDTFFRPLRNARKNDEIVLTTVDGTYRYRIGSIQVVGPDDTRVLRSGHRSTLTLVTCYPFDFVGAAPKRFVVQARKIGGGGTHG